MGRHPGGPNTSIHRSRHAPARSASRARSAKACTFAHSGFQLRSGFVIPYTGSSSSRWKVPKRRSHTISTPAWLRSRYFGLRPWCTRWCEGVFSTHSAAAPSRPTARVWIQNW